MENRKSKVRVKLLDSSGREIPKSEYDLDLGPEDFTFTLKKPVSGKYTVVMANDAGETREDCNVKFLGEIG